MKRQLTSTFLLFFLLFSALQAQNSDLHLNCLKQADQLVNEINRFNNSFRLFNLLPDSVRITSSFNDTDLLNSTNYHLFYENDLITKVEYLVETGNPDWDTQYRIYFRLDDKNRRISGVEYSVHDGFLELFSSNLNYTYINDIQVKMTISGEFKIMNGDSLNIAYESEKIDYYQRLQYNVDKKRWDSYREYFDISYDGNKITAFSHNETELANNKIEKLRYENIEDVRTFVPNYFVSANSFYNYDTMQFSKVIFSQSQGSEYYPNLRGGYDLYKYDDNTSENVLKEKRVLVDNGLIPVVNEYDPLNSDHIIKINAFKFNQDNKLEEITTEGENTPFIRRVYNYNGLGRLSKVTHTYDDEVLFIENRIYETDAQNNLISYKHQNKSFNSEFSEEVIYLFYYKTELKIKSPEVDKMILYPNPAKDIIYFDTSINTIKYEVFDIKGVRVISGEGNTFAVINALIPGSYTMRLTTKNGISSGIFIKI